jgi:hypothetical protein
MGQGPSRPRAWVLGVGEHALGLLPPSLTASPRGCLVGVSLPPPHYIKALLRGELDTRGLRELLGKSSPLPSCTTPIPLSLVWLLDGLRRSEGDSTTARRSAVEILD